MNTYCIRVPDTPQRGVTLIEVMVALVLGLVMIGAAVQVFLSNKQSYRIEQALARVQENGRYAMLAMSRELRMAGFLGCASRELPNPKVRAADAPTFNDAPAEDWAATNIQGFENGAGWTPPSPLESDGGTALTVCDADTGGTSVCQTSDIVRIVRGGEYVAATVANMASPDGTFDIRTTDFDTFIGDNDLWFITDCRSVDILRAASTAASGSNTTVTPDNALSKSYNANSTVTPVIEAVYFVGDDGDGVPSLYRLPLSDPADASPAQAMELARGVEAMQVSYGVDTTGDESADIYATADGVGGLGGWGNVVSMRVRLLVKSTDPSNQTRILDNPVAVTFNGIEVNSGDDADYRLRLEYTFTVGIRNRVP